MKKILISLFFVLGFQTILAHDKISDAEKMELLAKTPFNTLYPISIFKKHRQILYSANGIIF